MGSRVGAVVSAATIAAYFGFRRARDHAWSLAIRHAFQSFGDRSVLTLPIRLAGVDGIAIGSDVYVGSGSWLQTIRHDGETGKLVLGDGTRIAGGCSISAAREVYLGRSVLLARNVHITDHEHAFDERNGVPIVNQGISNVSPVRIEDGAWLGHGVVVLSGVTIGAGSVVGANSVVTASIPERCVAVGAPAVMVRRLGGS